MCKNKKGFTLIEVIIALFLLMIGLMALLYTVSISISANLQNVLRDEAVAVAAQQMAFIRNSPFDQIPIGASQAIGLSSGAGTVTRSLRNTAVTYTVVTNVASLSAANDALSVQVIVSWSYKGSTVRHSVTTMVPRGA